MRSNLCRVAGLLPVLLLAAILGSICSVIKDGSIVCFFGYHCMNHENTPELGHSRRILWAKLIFLERPDLLNFAKRQPLVQTLDTFNSSGLGASNAADVADVLSDPCVSPSLSGDFNFSSTGPVQNCTRYISIPAPSPGALIAVSPSANGSSSADCRPTCPDGYTYTPPGAASCGCVIPMHAQLRLGIKLESLFPLVSELSKELAEGLFLQISQVRIVGANAADQSQDKTDVNADFVPLDTFDNTTAQLLSSRLWSEQVQLNTTLFGVYSVEYVKYPGLLSSPPSPFSGNIAPSPVTNSPTSNATILSAEDKLGTGLIIVIVLASVLGVMIITGIIWLVILRRSLHEKVPPSVIGPLQPHSATKRLGLGSLLSGSMASSTTISFVSSMATYSGTARTFTIAELERATDNFSLENVVGEGGFGRVYQGVLDDGCEVAVKVLTRDDQQGGREFIAEVEMLSRLHHRNLVKLIGICTEDPLRCLVYELITNGSVESHLHGPDKRTAPLDWDARVKIALGAARGLAYLHEDSNPRVIHRDFKASNILLEDDYNPKVSDFGLAKAAAEGGKEHISTRVMGTFGYVAPEYAMTGHLLVKSDVYSYGVVLLELLSGRKPVDMSQPQGQENLVTWARPLLTSLDGLELIVDPDLGDNFPLDAFARVAAIASMCVQPEVSHRPFMGEVVQALKLIYNDSDTSENGRGTSPISDLVITQQSRFLPEASFVNICYNSGPMDDLDFQQPCRPLSASAILSDSGRFIRQLSGSFRRYCSSDPLKTSSLPRAQWRILDNAIAVGTMSERGVPRYMNPSNRRSLPGIWP